MDIPFRANLLRLLRTALAFVVFGALAGSTLGLVVWEVRATGNIVEAGVVETVQVCLLVLAAASYFLLARRRPGLSRAFALAGLALLAMAFRELDGIFDALLFHGAWRIFVGAAGAGSLAIVCGSFRRTVDQAARFVETPHFTMLATGVVSAVVIAQILGFKGLWNATFDIEPWRTLRDALRTSVDLDVPRHVKNIVEEALELASYLILLASAVLPAISGSKAGRDLP